MVSFSLSFAKPLAVSGCSLACVSTVGFYYADHSLREECSALWIVKKINLLCTEQFRSNDYKILGHLLTDSRLYLQKISAFCKSWNMSFPWRGTSEGFIPLQPTIRADSFVQEFKELELFSLSFENVLHITQNRKLRDEDCLSLENTYLWYRVSLASFLVLGLATVYLFLRDRKKEEKDHRV